ncbi:protein TIC 20-IV, chloroplastic-like [Vigna unguiculata]|uniref:Protein TIC 20 n=1 Tax=Vigna unguiculata TaxID=3917 RepID=A0A4D6NBL4_VIGUN|nr:protein TIC 20-IV, chloroplastic-like [Vigna unguiculata]QCE10154.1 Chloroplast protein import component Tic20 [Vigna unguiculata]
MTTQLAAAHPSVLFVPPSSASPCLTRNKDLIPKRCSIINRKKNYAITAFAGNALGKSTIQLTADSSPLFAAKEARLSLRFPRSQRRNSTIRGQAFIYHSSGFRIPANAEKPEWWWRALSCVPYLIALQTSAAGIYLEPILEKFPLFHGLIFYIPGAVNRLPNWFPMLYCYVAIVWVVKNKDLPLIFRFHVMMGMLLELALQIVWISSNFMPLIHFKGTLGTYYWAGVALAYIFVMIRCIRCALLGTFVSFPVLSESAFLHSLFSLGGFQRPF